MLCIFYHKSIYLNLLLFTTFITIILIWNTVISHLHYDNSLLKHLPAFNLAPMSVRSLHTTAEWCFKPLGRCCNLPDQNSVRMNSNSKIELVIKDLGLCSCFHSSLSLSIHLECSFQSWFLHFIQFFAYTLHRHRGHSWSPNLNFPPDTHMCMHVGTCTHEKHIYTFLCFIFLNGFLTTCIYLFIY